MNSITQEQLEHKQLERLAAQRQIYSDAKKIQAINMILSVPAVIVWSILVVKFPDLKIWSAFWGITVTFLGFIVFNPFQKELQEKAAKIQQLFDCDVLQLSWNELNSGKRPEPELICQKSRNYRRNHSDYSKLKDWYPIGVSQLPIHLGRLVCQRTNCWWDAQLRRRYAYYIQLIIIGLSIFVFLIGFINGLTLEKFFLAVFFPLTPVLFFGINQYRDNIEAASRLDRLKDEAESYWRQAINQKLVPQELTQLSYKLQNSIYDNRRRNPLIFDWIYNRIRDENEEQMNQGAEALIEELFKNP
ncbi:hypothetical protein Sta7437_4931 (plasmid) [Stanieria cyanosphaera PCC 7437]|uniref:Uncharacterized protein n=1 Tax=Stanieria cyanosphaera (strain ATCC 29371 / PCC 7437) TaxID=111780 RepID=K9Y0U0_STAC7|nr:S-4TM family putative pore-forming effector [Stanieria cyanosphaera]AFZ38358.1 hypothetical protein Sta7437_4931 [Stanieria cyanosphaera PCC 7437]